MCDKVFVSRAVVDPQVKPTLSSRPPGLNHTDMEITDVEFAGFISSFIIAMVVVLVVIYVFFTD